MRVGKRTGVVLLLVSIAIVVAAFAAANQASQSRITSNDDFFTLSIGPVPQINANNWTLRVDGLVDHSMNITYQQLLSMPNVTELASLRCVTGLSGTAYWTGVPMPYFLNLIGPKASALEMVFFSADGYSTSLTLAELNRSDILLCWGMNNVTLPDNQGYPLKLVVPEDWGYKWAKWITHIQLVDYDYKGYWESVGWADNAQISPVNDWRVHALLLSVAAVFGTFSALSGMRNSRQAGIASKLPAIFQKKYHRYSSYVFYGMFFLVFVFWVITTLSNRGAVFYTLHGRLALLTVAFGLAGALTGSSMLSDPRRYATIHWVANMSAYLLLLVTIALGILLTLTT